MLLGARTGRSTGRLVPLLGTEPPGSTAVRRLRWPKAAVGGLKNLVSRMLIVLSARSTSQTFRHNLTEADPGAIRQCQHDVERQGSERYCDQNFSPRRTTDGPPAQ